jgi:hypothetical protein
MHHRATGQGAVPGLSLSHDLLAKGYGGALNLEASKEEGSCFI